MAFFKFRFPGPQADVEAAVSAPPESLEGMRRRARHRLIGAAVLVLAAVIGFPLVFDTQPRPVAVDVPIQIPDRAKAKPLVAPESPASAAVPRQEAPPATVDAPKPAQVAASASLDAREEVVGAESGAKKANPVAASVATAPLPVSKEVKREPVAAPKPEPKAQAAATPADDGQRARALLEGKNVAKSAAVDAGRFIVQVGAFADATKARETRLKVERAGLTTYTQVVETKEGKRIRVRVGPFPSKTEADKAAGKIRGLDLPAAILSL